MSFGSPAFSGVFLVTLPSGKTLFFTCSSIQNYLELYTVHVNYQYNERKIDNKVMQKGPCFALGFLVCFFNSPVYRISVLVCF